MRYTFILLAACLLGLLIREWRDTDGPETMYSARYQVANTGELVLDFVHGDQRVLSEIQRSKPLHQRVWQRFNTLFPRPMHPHINCFIAMTDGNKGLSAYVRAAHRPGKWCLAVDISEMAPGNKIRQLRADRTLIHEFAHVLMVREDQYGYDNYGPQCMATETLTGCPKPDAYFTRFWLAFWLANPELGQPVPSLTPLANTGGPERYKKFPEKFVSIYAATNAVEDFAESWMTFVLKPDVSSGGPDANLEKKSKVLFFNQFPELVALRAKVRQRLGMQ